MRHQFISQPFYGHFLPTKLLNSLQELVGMLGTLKHALGSENKNNIEKKSLFKSTKTNVMNTNVTL